MFCTINSIIHTSLRFLAPADTTSASIAIDALEFEGIDLPASAAPVATTTDLHPTFLVELREGFACSDLEALLEDYTNAAKWGVGPISAALLYGDRHYAIAAVTLLGQGYGSGGDAVAFSALKNVAEKCYVYHNTGEIFADVLDADTVGDKEIWTKVQSFKGQLVYHKGSLALEVRTCHYTDEGDDIYEHYPIIANDNGELVIA